MHSSHEFKTTNWCLGKKRTVSSFPDSRLLLPTQLPQLSTQQTPDDTREEEEQEEQDEDDYGLATSHHLFVLSISTVVCL